MESDSESPLNTASGVRSVSAYDPDPPAEGIPEPEKDDANNDHDTDGSAIKPDSSLLEKPGFGLEKVQLQKLLNSMHAQFQLQQKQFDLLQGLFNGKVASKNGKISLGSSRNSNNPASPTYKRVQLNSHYQEEVETWLRDRIPISPELSSLGRPF